MGGFSAHGANRGTDLSESEHVLRFIDGSEFRITKSAADTSGECLEMEWFLPPSTETPPKHVHSQQREDYEVLDGAFEASCETDGRPCAQASRHQPLRERCTLAGSASSPCGYGTCTPRRSTSRNYFATESALMQASKIRSYSSPRAAHYPARAPCQRRLVPCEIGTPSAPEASPPDVARLRTG